MYSYEKLPSSMGVVGESVFITPSGIKTARDIRPGDYVWTENGWDLVIEAGKVHSNECVEVRTKNSFSILCIPQQEFVLDGCYFNSKETIKAKDIVVGNNIAYMVGPYIDTKNIVDLFTPFVVDEEKEDWLNGVVGRHGMYIIGVLAAVWNYTTKKSKPFFYEDKITFAVKSNKRKTVLCIADVLKFSINYNSFHLEKSTNQLSHKKENASFYFTKPQFIGNNKDFVNTPEEQFYGILKLCVNKLDFVGLDFVKKSPIRMYPYFITGFIDGMSLFRSYENTLGVCFYESGNPEFLKKLRYIFLAVGIYPQTMRQFSFFRGIGNTKYFFSIEHRIFWKRLYNYINAVRRQERVSYEIKEDYKSKLSEYNLKTIYYRLYKNQMQKISFRALPSLVANGSLPPNALFPIEVHSVENKKKDLYFYYIKLETTPYCFCNGLCLHTQN